MGKLDSIATIGTLIAGGLVLLKFYPLIEGFLKSDPIGDAVSTGGGFLESLIPVPVESQPLRTYEPVLDVRPVLTEDTAVIPDTTIPVSPQRLEYQEAIGVPIVTPEQIAPIVPPVVQEFFEGTTSMQDLMSSLSQQKAPEQFWVNPLTQEQIAPYVLGQTPQAVLDLRAEDILPGIRGF